MVLRLPALTAGDSVWRLPVSNVAAVQLLGGLFAENRQLQVTQLSQTLAEEPALALWATIQAFPDGVPPSVDALADWWTQQPATVLRGATDAGPPEQVLAWSRLCEACVSRAREAAALYTDARPDDPGAAQASPQQAYLLALLSLSIDWLCSSGSPVSWDDCCRGQSCLPNWLVDVLAELKHHTASSPHSGGAAVSSLAPEPSGTEVVDYGTCLDLATRSLLEVVAAVADAQLGRETPSESKSEQSERGVLSRRWVSNEFDGIAQAVPQSIAKLARLDELETQFELQLETEKLASLYWLAYGASHEINNPLANISARAQTLLRDEADPERRRMLATMNSQALRAHEMINDLMLFANPPEIVLGEVDTTELLQDVIDEVRAVADAQGTALHGHSNVGPRVVRVDREHFTVALQALLKNSLQALVSGGRIDLSAGWCDAAASPRSGFQIVVSDTGPGIPPKIRRHIFDPFFSGRESGRGLGAGLSKCWRIVELHGGHIDVSDGQQGGTTFRIVLPGGARISAADSQCTASAE